MRAFDRCTPSSGDVLDLLSLILVSAQHVQPDKQDSEMLLTSKHPLADIINFQMHIRQLLEVIQVIPVNW